jgi:hypothetical protein
MVSPVRFTPRDRASSAHWIGPQSRSGRRGEEKILDPHRDSNSNPSVVQPVTSRYTDWAIPAPELHVFASEKTVLFIHCENLKSNVIPVRYGVP